MRFHIALNQHFRGKVRYRPEKGLRVICMLGQSKISESQVPFSIDKNVGGF